MSFIKSVRFLFWGLGIVIGLALILSFIIPKKGEFKLTSEVELEVNLRHNYVSKREAFLVTGKSGHGSFLYFIYETNNKARIGYDAWGSGGPISQPFDFPKDRVLKFKICYPGANPNLTIETPNLVHLNVSLDGVVLLNQEVGWYPIVPAEIYFGHNPIGGSSCSDSFSGSIKMNGKPLWGVPRSEMSLYERLRQYVIDDLGKFIFAARLFVISIIITFGSVYGIVLLWRRYRNLSGESRRAYFWFIISIMPCVSVFFYYITRGRYHLFEIEVFGNFYDYQARSLLQGRLDVPYVAIGGEAFVFQNKLYGYFGLTPAIFRLPFAFVNFTPGILSRLYMGLYYIVSLYFSFLILRLIGRKLRGPSSEPSSLAIVLTTLNVGLGSAFLFLGARAYTYHEAILCGATFSLVSVYFALHILFTGSNKSWVMAWVFALISIHARPTTGLFSFLFLVAIAIYIGLSKAYPKLLRGWAVSEACHHLVSYKKLIVIITLCGIGVGTFNLVSYFKFHEFSGFPLRYNVQYTPERLANFGGKEFQLGNLAYDFYQYFSGATFSLSKHFPYYIANNDYQSASSVTPKIDMIEPTLGMPWFMPALVGMAIFGTLYILIKEHRLIPAVIVTWLAMLPVSVILLCAVVISQRYTADFCPFIIILSALGLASVDSLALRTRIWVMSSFGVFTLAAVIITSLVCVSFQGGHTLGVSDADLRHYEWLKLRVDRLFGVNH